MGAKPTPKRGTGGKTPLPPFRLLLCLGYIGGCRGISTPFILPHPKSLVPVCWVVERVVLKFLLIITPKVWLEGFFCQVFTDNHTKGRSYFSDF